MFPVTHKAKSQLPHLVQFPCLANSPSPHGKRGQATLPINTILPPVCLDPSQDAGSLQNIMQKAKCPPKLLYAFLFECHVRDFYTTCQKQERKQWKGRIPNLAGCKWTHLHWFSQEQQMNAFPKTTWDLKKLYVKDMKVFNTSTLCCEDSTHAEVSHWTRKLIMMSEKELKNKKRVPQLSKFHSL